MIFCADGLGLITVYRYFKPPFPRSARAAGSREAVNRVVFGVNPPLSMTIHPLNRPESPRFSQNGS